MLFTRENEDNNYDDYQEDSHYWCYDRNDQLPCRETGVAIDEVSI
jgi:hypothetical protein